jgi:hypothetical protein
MSAFRSATTDFVALRRRREELFGESWCGSGAEPGTANGVDTTRPASSGQAAPPDPGHYPGY